jgi:flavin reductase (DIM6/NTAB) family NADH-FMN oxidoreductase RutF
MFYIPQKNDHHLPHNPYKSCIVPRPIGWICSMSKGGIINVAPFSYFNAISDFPAMVMFSSCNKNKEDTKKDTVINISSTKEFVVNIATFDLKDEMNVTSSPLAYGESEAELAKLELEKSNIVQVPRIKKSPINLECILHEIINLPAEKPILSNTMVIGKVVGINIDDNYLTNGIIDIAKIKPIARLGYQDYAVIDKIFTMQRPK